VARRRGRVSDRQRRWFGSGSFSCAVMILVFMRTIMRDPLRHPTSEGVGEMQKVLMLERIVNQSLRTTFSISLVFNGKFLQREFCS